MGRNKNQHQNNQVLWPRILSSFLITFIWTMFLVYIETNEDRFLILKESKSLMLIVAGFSISFAWQSVFQQLERGTRIWPWIHHYVVLLTPIIVLFLWLGATMLWPLLQNENLAPP